MKTQKFKIGLLKHNDETDLPTYWIRIPDAINLSEIHLAVSFTQLEPITLKTNHLKIKLKKKIKNFL